MSEHTPDVETALADKLCRVEAENRRLREALEIVESAINDGEVERDKIGEWRCKKIRAALAQKDGAA